MKLSNVIPMVHPTAQHRFSGLEINFSTRAGLEDACIGIDDSRSKIRKRDELVVDAITLGTHPIIGEISDDIAQQGDASVYIKTPKVLIDKVTTVLREFKATVAGATSTKEIFDNPGDQAAAHERAVAKYNQHRHGLIPLMESVSAVPLERFPIGKSDWATVDLYSPRRATLAKQ